MLGILEEVLSILEEVLAMLEEVLVMLEEVLGRAFCPWWGWLGKSRDFFFVVVVVPAFFRC